jgi:ABC-type transporter Mla MlaB component
VDTGSLKSPRADVVYDDGVLRIIRTGSPPVLAMAGEIDESSYPGLVRTLQELVHGQGDVHVNLAGLTYCDLAGLRAIIRLAGAGAEGQDHGSRRLVLHDVPQHLRTVLRIIGWDTTSGLAIDQPVDEPAQLPSAAFRADHNGLRATAGGLSPAYDHIEG